MTVVEQIGNLQFTFYNVAQRTRIFPFNFH